MKCRFAAVIGLGLVAVLASGANRAWAADYVINDQASCQAFLSGIGGTGFWLGGDACYVQSGTLPAGSTLTVGDAAMLRVQTGTFTNQGSITINSTGRGFYGAGTFDNEGIFIILAADTPENYATILNNGQFQTAIPFGNYGTFTNLCNGTVTGTITVHAPVTDCAVPVQPMTWSGVKARHVN